MTGISHLNILVQQGGKAQELQQTRQQTSEHTQSVAAQDQMARDAVSKGQVQVTEESERAHLKRDGSRKKKDDQPSGEEKKKKKQKEEKTPASTGNLLNTVV
jgi:hypothetical protein